MVFPGNTTATEDTNVFEDLNHFGFPKIFGNFQELSIFSKNPSELSPNFRRFSENISKISEDFQTMSQALQVFYVPFNDIFDHFQIFQIIEVPG